MNLSLEYLMALFNGCAKFQHQYHKTLYFILVPFTSFIENIGYFHISLNIFFLNNYDYAVSSLFLFRYLSAKISFNFPQ
jgi:hypothetical protein